MLTFLHAADFHLDSPFHALPPDQAAERRQEQRQLLTRLADAARQSQADLIFLAGDLFDSQRVRPETIQALYQVLEELEAEVFLSPGNHDPYTKVSPYHKFTWPSHVHFFTTPTPQRVELPQLGAVVYGGAFTASYRMDSPLAGLHAQEEGLAAFGCFHGDPASAHSRYGPIPQKEIAASGLDYLALGHLHTASGLLRAGKTWYAWPGCPEGRGFDETGDKGVYLGQWEAGRVKLEFLPLARRRYLTPQIDITGRDPADALEAYIRTARPEDILCITLTGQRDPEAEPDLTALTALASSYFYSASLYDNTCLSQSIWARRDEDTLTGLFLRAMAQRLQEAHGGVKHDKAHTNGHEERAARILHIARQVEKPLRMRIGDGKERIDDIGQRDRHDAAQDHALRRGG